MYIYAHVHQCDECQEGAINIDSCMAWPDSCRVSGHIDRIAALVTTISPAMLIWYLEGYGDHVNRPVKMPDRS